MVLIMDFLAIKTQSFSEKKINLNNKLLSNVQSIYIMSIWKVYGSIPALKVFLKVYYFARFYSYDLKF